MWPEAVSFYNNGGAETGVQIKRMDFFQPTDW
jgi:hypothetical protein